MFQNEMYLCKIFTSDMRINQPLKLPQNVMVPTVYIYGAVRITAGSLLAMGLNVVSSIVVF